VTISLVRHAAAGSRSRWTGPDADRPLSPRGRDQATDIAARLAPRRPTRVLSSRYLRCAQTVGPLAIGLGLAVETHAALAEGTDVRQALALIDELAAAGADTVLCSHGDVIPEVLDHLERHGVELVGGHACAKGSIWDLEVRDGSVVRATYHPPER
jgi:8-oxo-dGTP diphosphatase